MTNDFDLTDGIMAPPWWSDQSVLEVVIHHWDMDDAYTDGDNDDDTDDDNDHKKDSYTAAGAAPDAGAAPIQTRPDQTRPDQTKLKKIMS